MRALPKTARTGVTRRTKLPRRDAIDFTERRRVFQRGGVAVVRRDMGRARFGRKRRCCPRRRMRYGRGTFEVAARAVAEGR